MGFFGLTKEKGPDCNEDENGVKQCRAMIKSKNSKLATGSEWSIAVDKNCKAHIVGRYSVFEEDEDIVRKTLKQSEVDCRGGIN